MKFIKKIPTADQSLKKQLLSYGWTIVKEPSNIWKSILVSIPLMFFSISIYLMLIFNINQIIYKYFDIQSGLFLTLRNINIFSIPLLLEVYIFTIAHELIHLLFIPNALKSDNVYLGITPFYGFVYTSEQISKYRFLISSIMPFFILSIILPVLLNFFGFLTINTCLLCLLNALGSSVDLLNIILICIQVPNKSMLINNGFETYYK